MYNNCNILNEVEFLKNYRFPLDSENGYVTSCVNYLIEYSKNVKKCSFLFNQDKKNIFTLCNNLIEVLKTHNTVSEEMFFDNLTRYKNIITINNHDWLFAYQMYRMNSPKPNGDYKNLDMLHIPIEKASIIKSFRYSLAGHPCSYFSTEPMLCWYECDMPLEFYIAKFKVSEEFERDKQRILRLTINPICALRELEKCDKDKTVNFATQLLYAFPLVIACSFIAENKDCAFINEYYIPQLLMRWVIKNDDILGISYYSNSKYSSTRKYCGYNLAIPTRKINLSGYCQHIKKYIIPSNAKWEQKIKKSEIQEQLFDFFDKLRLECKRLILLIQTDSTLDSHAHKKINMLNAIIMNIKLLFSQSNSLSESALVNLKMLGESMQKENDFNCTIAKAYNSVAEKLEDLEVKVFCLIITETNKSTN